MLTKPAPTRNFVHMLNKVEPPLLRVSGLRKSFASGGALGGSAKHHVLRDVSFSIQPGEVVALVGESGSGKSTIARLIARLYAPDAGELLWRGHDVLKQEPRGASLAYRRDVQMVFQDPFGSLNPVHTVSYHLERPLLRHGLATRDTVKERVHALLTRVGLTPAPEMAARYPHALSGGQRQRVAIARALAVGPSLLLADEPTSMLDVSLRLELLNLISERSREDDMALLFITHDLASARYLADRILVLYAGQVVEVGPSAELIAEPRHPYTQLLVAAAPQGSGSLREPLPAGPGRPDPLKPAIGCAFVGRCRHVMGNCEGEMPSLRALSDGQRQIRCHLPDGVEGVHAH
ncbi:MAG: ABC transporter ATP-binding protein [Myxococcota bacterium]